MRATPELLWVCSGRVRHSALGPHVFFEPASRVPLQRLDRGSSGLSGTQQSQTEAPRHRQ